ncbi:hypothetical protein HDV05_007582 [Chytridiales sp. JEL 0842]|nr:hypothetical protein HDV05_007582 [Chytridiales sp. JEL 0842]
MYPLFAWDPAQGVGSSQRIRYPFSDTEDSADESYRPKYSVSSDSRRTPKLPQPLSPLDDDADDEDDEADSPKSQGYDSDGDAALDYPTNTVDSMNIERVIRSGFLKKKGEQRKTWKKRWFVLRATRLSYYKNSKEYELLCVIALADVHTIAEVEHSKRSYVFGLVTRKRTYYLRAETASEMESWMHCLKEAWKDVRKTVGVPQPIKTRVSSTGPGAKPSSPTAIGSSPGILSSSVSNAAISTTASMPPALSTSAMSEGLLMSPRPSDGGQRVHFAIEGEINRIPPSRAQSASRTRINSGSSPVARSSMDDQPTISQTPVKPILSTIVREPQDMTQDTQSQLSQPESAITAESQLTYVSTPSTEETPTQSNAASLPTFPNTPTQVSNAVDAIQNLNLVQEAAEVDRKSIEEVEVPQPAHEDSVTATVAPVDVPVIPPTTESPVLPPPPSDTVAPPISIAVTLPSRLTLQSSADLSSTTSSQLDSALESPYFNSATSSSPYNREGILSSSEDEDYNGGGETGADTGAEDQVGGTILDKVIFSGYLQKQGTVYNKNWKKRWFVLRSGKLTSYKNSDEYVAKRVYPLRTVLDVLEIDSNSKAHPFCFKVVLPKRSLILSAEKQEDMVAWIEALRFIHCQVSPAKKWE